jgi:sodium/proline symporter
MVMLGSMALLLVFASVHAGGPIALFTRLEAIDPALVQWLPTELALGFALYFLGFVFGGLGAVGQPHILIRSMAIRSSAEIPRARRIYFAWFLPFSVAAVYAGLYARVLLPELLSGAGDAALAQAAENALPHLSMHLLPSVLIGLMLAGIFSATMSTADSQILSCSAALTQDIVPRYRESYVASKLATLGVTLLALTIALSASQGVFELVLIAWSALGATLGPLLVLRVCGRVPSASLSLAMLGSGLVTVVWWGASDLADDVFKLLPGMLVPFLVYAAAGLFASVRAARAAPLTARDRE